MNDTNNEILEKLTDRTIGFFIEELSLDISKEYTIKSVDEINYLDISTLISLSGGQSGTIGMSVSNELSKTMAEAFLFGESTQEEIEALSVECVSETLNVTLGNILNTLSTVKNGTNINISTPYTMHSSVSISKKKNGVMLLAELKVQDQLILLSYFK